MTLEELNNVTYGFGTVCSGLTGSVPRLGWDGLCMNDAGQGVRGTDLVNAYAEGISVGASWNIELAYQRARYMGAEFWRKGGKGNPLVDASMWLSSNELKYYSM